MKTSPDTPALQCSIVWDQLKRFVAEKRAYAESICAAEGKEMFPEIRTVYDAADKGDLETIAKTLDHLRWLAPGADHRDWSKYCLRSQWCIAAEVWGVFREFWPPGEKYTIQFGRDVIASIPPGSIYFGGNDPGRFAITTLCKSHTSGDPFFVLTQNALIDKTYLRYLAGMYGSQIYIPTEEEFTTTYENYVREALQRQKENKLIPGEFLKEVNGKVEVNGVVGVMMLNAVLSKLMFDKNPDRDFYIEEAFPLEWMYPHLTPHGLILKINRQPPAELDAALVQRDRDYWKHRLRPILGDWLDQNTSIAEVASFAERVHLRKDLTGFDGDPEFIHNDAPQRMFSKLRSSLGGIYAWRAQHAESTAVKSQMAAEADLAFRQAFALCPRSAEAVFRYVNSRIPQQRFDDAILIAETHAKFADENTPIHDIAGQLRQMKLKAAQPIA